MKDQSDLVADAGPDARLSRESPLAALNEAPPLPAPASLGADPRTALQLPTIGRAVHYTLVDGKHLPATVTAIDDQGAAMLCVFKSDRLDHTAAGPMLKNGSDPAAATMLVGPVYGTTEPDVPFHWHWPERA